MMSYSALGVIMVGCRSGTDPFQHALVSKTPSYLGANKIIALYYVPQLLTVVTLVT